VKHYRLLAQLYGWTYQAIDDLEFPRFFAALRASDDEPRQGQPLTERRMQQLIAQAKAQAGR
jgi:hypothetical protein